MLPRVILILAIATVGGLILKSLAGTQNRTTFRPRKNQRAHRGGEKATTFIVSRAELVGIRDSFSAEPIDPDRALMRCPACQAVYHADSIVTLERENHGQCVNCSGKVFDTVQVAN